MSKPKIKAIINRFLKVNDPKEFKESLQEMYYLTMTSDHEIAPDERQRFAYYCREMMDLLNELNAVRKKMFKNPASTIISFFAFLLF